MMKQLSHDLSNRSPATSEGTFFYIQNLDRYHTEKPYLFTGFLEPSQEHLRTNIVREQRNGILVRDLRSVVASQPMSLDTHGFQFVTQHSKFATSIKEPGVLEGYLQETSDYLKELLSAELALCYNFKFRKSSFSDSDSLEAFGTAELPDLPIWPVHIDFTEESGLQRVIRTLNERERDLYMREEYRIRIINSWRPLYRPVENSPLAFCDPKSIKKEDLIAVDRPAPEQYSESYYLKYNPDQEYYWISNQTPDEISFFTSWDSSPGNSPPYCPHSAFNLPTPGNNNIVRESIETRTVVITKRILTEEPA